MPKSQSSRAGQKKDSSRMTFFSTPCLEAIHGFIYIITATDPSPCLARFRGTTENSARLQRPALVLLSRFIGDKKDGGVQPRIIDLIKLDGLAKKRVVAEIFVGGVFVVAVAPASLGKAS
jgi:hypothetical protein